MCKVLCSQISLHSNVGSLQIMTRLLVVKMCKKIVMYVNLVKCDGNVVC